MNLSYYRGAVLLAVGVLVGSLVMIGCEPIEEASDDFVKFDNIFLGDSKGTLKTVEYEGHRYVICTVYHGAGICHAGDCPCRRGTPCDCTGEKDSND